MPRVASTAEWELNGLSLPREGMLRVRSCTADSTPVPVVQTSTYLESARDFTWSASSTAVTLKIYYGGGGGTVVIPDTVGWKPVTTIERFCFPAGSGLTKLILPATITGLDSMTFLNTPDLAEIIVEPGNKNLVVREGVVFNSNFFGAVVCPPGKTGVCNLPAGLYTISTYAFYNCKQLTAVDHAGEPADHRQRRLLRL